MIEYICPHCYEKIDFKKTNFCKNCKIEFNFIDGIPIFTKKNIEQNPSSFGFFSKLFNSPTFYDYLIKLKVFFFPDKFIGLKQMLKSQNYSLLSLGCGSNVSEKHLEYDLNNLSHFHGCDISIPFVKAAKKNCKYKNTSFSVCSIENLPFANKTFDVTLISFVLHHLNYDLEKILKEAFRVSKKYVVIYDHLKSKNKILGSIQSWYWNTFDGGFQYLDEDQWRKLLRNCKVKKKLITGSIGNHVVKYILTKA